MRLFYQFLQFCFPQILFYRADSAEWHITLDDSPSKNTLWVLDMLDVYELKATFFCIGKNIEDYPEYFQEIVRRGHQVGYHSYTHINAWRQTFNEFKLDFEKCETIFSSKLYRPPYGKLTWNMYRYLRKKGIKIVLWDILTEDWKQLENPTKKIISKMNQARDGSIFVFHDNQKAFLNLQIMLTYVLEHYKPKTSL